MMIPDYWETTCHLDDMIEYVSGKTSERKMRLFLTGCCRLIGHCFPEQFNREHIFGALESIADNPSIASTYFDLRYELEEALAETPYLDSDPLLNLEPWAAMTKHYAIMTILKALEPSCNPKKEFSYHHVFTVVRFVKQSLLASTAFALPGHAEGYSLIKETDIQLANLFREIMENPFCPMSIKPTWLQHSLISLARTIYQTNDFELMPILGDALEDAGCDHEDALQHCRMQHHQHRRGCWVVDSILETIGDVPAEPAFMGDAPPERPHDSAPIDCSSHSLMHNSASTDDIETNYILPMWMPDQDGTMYLTHQDENDFRWLAYFFLSIGACTVIIPIFLNIFS